MCRGHVFKGYMEIEGEQKGAERVSLLHGAGGEDWGGAVWRHSQENL
jgi:hypothetical protein